MSLCAAVIRELIAAGLSGDALVSACERIEKAAPAVIDVQAERRRAADRERKASLRNSAESADPLPKVSEVPHTPPNLPNPSPPKTPLKGVKKVPAAIVPEGWEISEAGLQYATDQGMDLNTAVEEQNRFRDNSRSKGVKYLDFEAAWRNWVRNWQKWRADARPPPASQSRQQPLFRS
jgi:hypothetical protein